MCASVRECECAVCVPVFEDVSALECECAVVPV